MSDALANLWEDDNTLTDASLQELEDRGFPYSAWSEQINVYRENERWFKGEALADQDQEAGEAVDLYPLRINPLPSTAMKHAAILFGEVEDDGRPLVYPKFIPRVKDEKSKKIAIEAEEIINHLWWENNGRSAMLVNGILSQIYGGCAFRLAYVPWESSRVFPLRIEAINPKTMVGFPDGGDMYRLQEGWYVKRMRQSEAAEWGYTGSDPVVWFAEKWTRTEHQVLIDGKPAARNGLNLSGDNPFGFVPMVYIPHIRVGEFIGLSLIDNLKGIIQELNLRYGDYGDAVNEDAHTNIAIRNITGSVKYSELPSGLKVYDLGSKSALSGNEGDPDMYEVSEFAKASSSMESLVDSIWKVYRRDAFYPAVADGEDEGSQRSGLTLAIRFWPLTSHVNLERIFWTVGLDVLESMALKMLQKKDENGEKYGVTLEHTVMRSKQKWAPMLPRDREIDVQEWTNRAAQDIAPIETLLENAGDIEDIEEAKKQILAWKEAMTEIEYAAQAKYGIQMGGFGQGNSDQGGAE